MPGGSGSRGRVCASGPSPRHAPHRRRRPGVRTGPEVLGKFQHLLEQEGLPPHSPYSALADPWHSAPESWTIRPTAVPDRGARCVGSAPQEARSARKPVGLGAGASDTCTRVRKRVRGRVRGRARPGRAAGPAGRATPCRAGAPPTAWRARRGPGPDRDPHRGQHGGPAHLADAGPGTARPVRPARRGHPPRPLRPVRRGRRGVSPRRPPGHGEVPLSLRLQGAEERTEEPRGARPDA